MATQMTDGTWNETRPLDDAWALFENGYEAAVLPGYARAVWRRVK